MILLTLYGTCVQYNRRNDGLQNLIEPLKFLLTTQISFFVYVVKFCLHDASASLWPPVRTILDSKFFMSAILKICIETVQCVLYRQMSVSKLLSWVLEKRSDNNNNAARCINIGLRVLLFCSTDPERLPVLPTMAVRRRAYKTRKCTRRLSSDAGRRRWKCIANTATGSFEPTS